MARCAPCQGACVVEDFEPDVSTSVTDITLKHIATEKKNHIIREFEKAVDLRHRISGKTCNIRSTSWVISLALVESITRFMWFRHLWWLNEKLAPMYFLKVWAEFLTSLFKNDGQCE